MKCGELCLELVVFRIQMSSFIRTMLCPSAMELYKTSFVCTSSWCVQTLEKSSNLRSLANLIIGRLSTFVMRLSVDVLAIVALVPLLNVTAAPVGGMQKRQP